MLEEIKRKEVDKRDRQLPQTFEQLIQMYDLERISQHFNGELIESGSNNNGDYKKYSDGTMICKKRFSQNNVRLTNQWHMLYINENDTTLNLGNYPLNFVSEPVVSLTYMGGNGCWIINNNDSSVSTPGKIQLATVSSRIIGTVIIDIIAIGRWK